MKPGKLILLILICTAAAFVLMGCGGEREFDETRKITTVAREPGSGTRGAFIDLFQLEYRGPEGTRKDLTTINAIVANKTDVTITSIAGDKHAIGYISVGSLNSLVKAVSIDGVEATVANVLNGTYKTKRSFLIATKDEPSDLALDFIDYILSKEGQAEVRKNNYVPAVEQAADYSGDKPGGRVVISGSSSVNPVMEKLKESYAIINPNGRIEIQVTDSTAGLNSLLNGTCDIAMTSRDLTETEKARMNPPILIASDGIAVIVNNDNPYDQLSSEQIRQIFIGEITHWNELQ